LLICDYRPTLYYFLIFEALKLLAYLKKLLLQLLFLFPVFSQAQTSVYHPFPDSNAFWCGWQVGYNGMCYWDDYYTVFFGNDTVINGNSYHTLRKTGGGVGCPGWNYNNHFVVAFRQDTAQRKVFMYPSPWGNWEGTFYNFNLQVGDTLDSSKVWWSDPWFSEVYIVTSIDSILIDGQYRKRYNHNGSHGCADSSLIEGIGGTDGVMTGPSRCFEHYVGLSLFSQNHQVLYPSSTASPSNYQHCHDFTLDVPELNDFSLSISPNPAHNILNVECNELKVERGELKMYDMLGREVMNEKLHSQLSTFNFQLSSGMYVVRVSDGNQTAVQKLIVE
jgi:hypothetical protein